MEKTLKHKNNASNSLHNLGLHSSKKNEFNKQFEEKT